MAQSDPLVPSSLASASILVLIAGLLAAAVGLATDHTFLAAAGLAVAVAGGAGLWLQNRRTLRAMREHEAILQELNRNLDEQVQARTRHLMQTIEDLESFNRMVTHDISSPLTSLLSGIDLLTLWTDSNPSTDLRMAVDTISQSAVRMQELVQDLRQLALISGRIPAIKAVDITHYATLVLKHLQQKEPHRKVVWSIEPGIAVYGDPNLIRIALENLLGNAWKYSLERNPAEIRVRRGPDPDLTVEIEDNGSGFDMAKASNLGQPFQRMHNDPRFPGSGIGLSIVKRVMARHGGRLTADGKPGQGATFRLEFPAGLDPREDEA